MKVVFCNLRSLYFGLNFGRWYFTVYLNPQVWAINGHIKAPCCKFWLVLGPFEINRTWCDEDDYPFDAPLDD